jgi:hypothetical protein
VRNNVGLQEDTFGFLEGDIVLFEKRIWNLVDKIQKLAQKIEILADNMENVGATALHEQCDLSIDRDKLQARRENIGVARGDL